MTSSSYGTILRSSSIIGGAQVANILANLVKMKILAVLLGPAGVGLAGILVSLMQTGATIASLGFGMSGAREIAAADGAGHPETVNRARKALVWGTAILAVLGTAAFWAARFLIAEIALGDVGRADEVGWLALGVGLTVAAGSQAAMLTGLRRVGDLARVQVFSGLSASILGVAAIWQFGEPGVLIMVLVAPLATFLLGHAYVARIGTSGTGSLAVPEFLKTFRAMAVLGAAFMISGLAAVLGQLLVRVLVQQEIDAAALGHFQAAWALSMTYLGFILSAMGTDYYPRLTAAVGEPEVMRQLINEQTEVALLLCAPALVGLLGVAPWAIAILYSADFGPAVDILRWQLFGDLLKVMSWPLGFVLLAFGVGRTYALVEIFGVGVFVLAVAVGLPAIGSVATGLGFFLSYVAYLPVVFWLSYRKIKFGWSRAVVTNAGLVLAAAIVTLAAASYAEPLGAMAGIVLAAVLCVRALLRFAHMTGRGGRLAALGRIGERLRR